MTGSISRIADRIRLLGLNASIEAAHAGKAGAGFAVVAREIQALSDQSLKAVQQIVEMLSGLGKQTEGLAGAVDLLHGDSKRLQGALNEAHSYVERLATMAETMQNLSARREAQ
jgi:methyl-accepting chemotaxis protein